MGVKAFIGEWKPKRIKDWSKSDQTNFVGEHINDIGEFYINEAHKANQAELVSEIFDRMETKAFAKALKRLVKSDNENKIKIDITLALVISSMIEERHEKLEEGVMDIYGKIVNKLLNKRSKDIVDDTKLDKDLIKELLVVVPHPDVVVNDKFIGVHVRNIMRKLYALAANNDVDLIDAKTIKKLFAHLFGAEQLNNVAVAILLERADTIRNFKDKQKEIWNLLTDFALSAIENNKKKEIGELLVDRYVGLRSKEDSKGRDSSRRIQFGSISEETYPKMVEVINKLKEQDKFAKYL